MLPDITLFVAHHDCDEERDATICKNLIYKLDLYTKGAKEIFSKETLIKDASAPNGQLWGLDYSYRQNRLFVTDRQTEAMR